MTLRSQGYHRPDAESVPAISPHQVLDLTRASERTLRELVQLHRLSEAPAERIALAGVPPLRDLMHELQRRANAAPTILATQTGPRWQDLFPGMRVTPKGGRKRGTVVRIIEPRTTDGTAMHVA